MESQKAANALERVQNESKDKIVDTDSAQKALQGIGNTGSAVNSQPKIKIREEDIKVLMAEMEIERAEAEKALISTGGDFKEALYNLIIS